MLSYARLMLALTGETGQPVRTADGTTVGHLRDLTARIGSPHPVVHRLLVGTRHRATHLVPWSEVASFERSGVQLRDAEPISAYADGFELGDDELLLVRDVLDTQIVDVVGHRLARVADVLLTRLPDQRLEVAAVDVGMGAVCRRLGLRLLGERLPERAVDWRDLHLTSSRGHLVQLATTAAAVHRLDARGLAELLTRLDVDSATDVLRTVGPERAANAVAATHPDVGGRLMLALGSEDAGRVLDQLPEEAGHHYRHVLRSRSPLTRRRFFRLRGWRTHRPRHLGRRPGGNHGNHGDQRNHGDHGDQRGPREDGAP
ncbi:hypothetical protein SAMN05421678_101557 [Actinopolymorpha cephalotaxi]|uniref:MgtE intracellular N domain-containing protein n=2 Tax=Actinopolymorpha cephalotaxi TaxID=504797 RepID=A0A1I2L1D3_9ACTN|nr:hypothetical protein SAMN05421678_101557 [Actinopolymorpha cephalotaxi]